MTLEERVTLIESTMFTKADAKEMEKRFDMRMDAMENRFDYRMDAMNTETRLFSLLTVGWPSYFLF